jgi:hypothetical protein
MLNLTAHSLPVSFKIKYLIFALEQNAPLYFKDSQ